MYNKPRLMSRLLSTLEKSTHQHPGTQTGSLLVVSNAWVKTLSHLMVLSNQEAGAQGLGSNVLLLVRKSALLQDGGGVHLDCSLLIKINLDPKHLR